MNLTSKTIPEAMEILLSIESKYQINIYLYLNSNQEHQLSKKILFREKSVKDVTSRNVYFKAYNGDKKIKENQEVS